jgi:hypothetical protein
MPLPEGPSNTTASPMETSKDTPRNACTSPEALEIPDGLDVDAGAAG